MQKKLKLVIISLLFIPLAGFTQKNMPGNAPGNFNTKTDTAQRRNVNIDSISCNKVTKITFNDYFGLLGKNLKHEFTKPFHMTGKDWGNLGKFSIAFGALCFSDEQIQKSSVTLANKNPVIKNISSYVTKFGGAYEKYTLGAFAAYGLLFKNPKMVNTTLLATQAYITGSAVEVALKLLSGRTRPNYYTSDVEAEPKFLGPFAKLGRDSYGKRRYSSFPSGHAIIAFGAATIFAKEYKDKKYIPAIAYTAATLVSLSRLIENRHWTTDVLTGAAIGYLTGKNIVNNYHRYARLKTPGQKRNVISCNLRYFNGQIMPGIIYSFK